MDNSDGSNVSNYKDSTPDNTGITRKLAPDNIGITPDNIAHQITDIDVLDKLCILCVRSKSTRTIRRDKSMINVTSKLKEVYVGLWESYDPPSQSGSLYTSIPI